MLERGDVLIADANTGWTQHAAMRVADAVRDVDVYIEQPCLTYEQCLAVRRHTNRPFVLDEVIDGLDMVVRGVADQAMDVINLKISKVGGLTKARQIRDLCVSLGIAMTIEDTWGGDIITAAIAHLAHSTPERFLFSATDFNSYVTVAFADGAPQRQAGRLAASRDPGLGVRPKMDVLGKPVGGGGGRVAPAARRPGFPPPPPPGGGRGAPSASAAPPQRTGPWRGSGGTGFRAAGLPPAPPPRLAEKLSGGAGRAAFLLKKNRIKPRPGRPAGRPACLRLRPFRCWSIMRRSWRSREVAGRPGRGSWIGGRGSWIGRVVGRGRATMSRPDDPEFTETSHDARRTTHD